MAKARWTITTAGIGVLLTLLAGFAGQCGEGAPAATPTSAPNPISASPTPSPTGPTIGSSSLATQNARQVPPPYAGKKNPYSPDDQAAVSQGALVYYDNCQFCHGAKGKGDGPSATGLVPPPADLTKLESLFTSQQDLDFWVVSEGIPGTAMPGFKDRLTEEQRWLALTYEWNLVRQANKR